MKRFFYLLIAYMLISYPSLITCKELETGTLVISYQTGHKGERLDRIRFLLTNDQQQTTMYPKKGCYVEDAACVMRVVIVEELLPGDYLLEFIIPNSDGLFEEVSTRKIAVTEGSTVKIDQNISIKYASIDTGFKVEGKPLPQNTYPDIQLRNNEGDTILRSKKGILRSSEVLPGEYLVVYGPLEGYATPALLPITLSPNEKAKPVPGVYR